MPHLRWAPEALEDLHRLDAFLKDISPDAAKRAIGTIRQSVKMIAARPAMGRPAKNRGPDRREWHIPFGSNGYVVLYRFTASEVRVLAVRHSREMGYGDE